MKEQYKFFCLFICGGSLLGRKKGRNRYQVIRIERGKQSFVCVRVWVCVFVLSSGRMSTLVNKQNIVKRNKTERERERRKEREREREKGNLRSCSIYVNGFHGSKI